MENLKAWHQNCISMPVVIELKLFMAVNVQKSFHGILSTLRSMQVRLKLKLRSKHHEEMCALCMRVCCVSC